MMKIENGKIIKLAFTNYISWGKCWGTFEQQGLYPDDFDYKPLQEELKGRAVNDHFLVSQHGLGKTTHTNELVLKLPMENFKNAKGIQKGMVFKTSFQMKTFTGVIISTDEQYVTLDCNFPDAGNKNLSMGVMVQDVRELTEEESKLGHKSYIRAI